MEQRLQGPADQLGSKEKPIEVVDRSISCLKLFVELVEMYSL